MISFNFSEKGQGLAEYGMIIILVAIVVIVLLLILGPQGIGNLYSNIVHNF
jgi:pilus assembly protein Flp/PilA